MIATAARSPEAVPNYSDRIRVWLTIACGIALLASLIPVLSSAAILAAVFGSYEAIVSAYQSLRARKLNVNLLMVIAAAGAVAVNRVADAAVLLFLFSLSTTLEALAMARTQSAISDLIRLRPSTANRVIGTITENVHVEELRMGDHIRVQAFEAVPTDGVIREGCTSIDTSAMTGESRPSPADVGSTVLGGTQNLDGTIILEVMATVGDSALDRIIGLVAESQANKASGERISDWFGQKYTIFVLAAFAGSLAVRLGFHQPLPTAFYLSLTLLVGMSPCALVISTPATTLSALAWCARHGILVRGGEFIEIAGRIKSIALDKTGTLTWGRPLLKSLCLFNKGGSLEIWQPNEPVTDSVRNALSAIAAVEQYSDHPLAKAMVAAQQTVSESIGIVSNHHVIAGLGVEGVTQAGKTYVGREQLIVEKGFDLHAGVESRIRSLEAAGNTVSLAAAEGWIAVLAFADEIRPNAPSFIQRVKKLGINRIVMLTGDRKATAESVAIELGISEVRAGLLPGQKSNIVKTLDPTGDVMMIGDGVNDAPSLASATLGIAMGGLGSDVAMKSADVILVDDNLDRIPSLIALGRRTTRTIRTNLFFAAAVVVSLTATSLLGSLPLPLAVLCHEGSTVLVILNGLRMLQGPRYR